jgi:hypothetical protein
MNPLTQTFGAACALVLVCASVHADTAQQERTRVVGAANAFLSTLDEKQRASGNRAVFSCSFQRVKSRGPSDDCNRGRWCFHWVNFACCRGAAWRAGPA